MFVSDTVIDPVKEGFDCTLQIFSPASEELIARKMFPVRRVFCASPAYLAQHGAPDNLRNLHEHRLGLYSGYQTRDRWDFFRGHEVISLHLKPPMLTNSVHMLAEYGCAGAGVVCIPTLVASRYLVSGELVPLLTDWQLSSFWLLAIFPHASCRAKSVKPADIRDVIAATSMKTVVGDVKWGGQGPFKNVSKTPLVLGQWNKGKKHNYDLVIVNNQATPAIPVGGKLLLMN